MEEVKVLRDEVEENRDLILALERRLNETVVIIKSYEQQQPQQQPLTPPLQPQQQPLTPSLQPQHQPLTPLQPQQQPIDFHGLNTSNNDALADLQHQMDNLTDVIFQAHQKRVELLLSEAKNDVKRLEEKTSNWLNRLGMEYENSMSRLSKNVESLAQAQAGLYYFGKIKRRFSMKIGLRQLVF